MPCVVTIDYKLYPETADGKLLALFNENGLRDGFDETIEAEKGGRYHIFALDTDVGANTRKRGLFAFSIGSSVKNETLCGRLHTIIEHALSKEDAVSKKIEMFPVPESGAIRMTISAGGSRSDPITCVWNDVERKMKPE